MKPQFLEEAKKRKQQIVEDLVGLIKIKSELTVFDHTHLEAPFGEGNRRALDYMLNLGKRDGFEVLDVDHYAGHIAWGDFDHYIGMIGHLDVVPAGNGWTYPPYAAEITDNKLYGRGTEDDKGPTIAAYHAMKMLKELNVPIKRQAKLILGCDEETAWRCVKRYFERIPQQPLAGFVPDSVFPLTYAEKGIARAFLSGKTSDSKLVSFYSGSRDNMVPEEAKAVINDIAVIEAFKTWATTHNVKNDCQMIEDDKVELTAYGKSAHASTPEEGVSAAFLLIDFLIEYGIKDDFLTVVADWLLHDAHGKKLGVDFDDEAMGPVTINAGIYQYASHEYVITLNPRYPHGVHFEDMMKTMENAFAKNNATLVLDNHIPLIYTNPDSPFVKRLMSSYQSYTNDTTSKPMTTGGGTFARAAKNLVAFGPHFPGVPSLAHQKDEFINLDDLVLVTAIYADALYGLLTDEEVSS